MQEIDDAYSTQFENDIFQNDIFICLVLKGLNQNKASTGLGFLKKLSDHAVKSARRERRTTDIEKIRTVTVQLIESLSDFSPSLLGENDAYPGQSELIGFLGLAINGCEKVLLRSGQVIQIQKNYIILKIWLTRIAPSSPDHATYAYKTYVKTSI